MAPAQARESFLTLCFADYRDCPASPAMCTPPSPFGAADRSFICDRPACPDVLAPPPPPAWQSFLILKGEQLRACIPTFVPRARKKRLPRGVFGADYSRTVVIVFGVPAADLQL
jgi:hypothetical protein